jgi:acyl-CoA hydrolase
VTDDMTAELAPSPTAFSRVTLARIMEPTDANLHGNVHGGVILRAVDNAAGAAAARHSRGLAVTAAIDEMAFLTPLRIGDILTVRAQVNWTGGTSMEVGVRVTAQPWDDADEESVHVASAYLVFVAIDENEKPRRVPPVVPQTDQDRQRWHEAEIRRRSRLARRNAMHEWRRTEGPQGV